LRFIWFTTSLPEWIMPVLGIIFFARDSCPKPSVRQAPER